jgi:hypothetical protein
MNTLSIRFHADRQKEYNKHRREWENSLPKEPNVILRLHVQPLGRGPDPAGQVTVSPIEPDFIEYLKRMSFQFSEETNRR